MSQDYRTTSTAQSQPAPVKIDKPLITRDKDLIHQEEENTFRKPNPVRPRESPPKTCMTDTNITLHHETDDSNNKTLLTDTNSHLEKLQKVPDDKENTTPQQNTQQTDSEVILRRTHSFESDDA